MKPILQNADMVNSSPTQQGRANTEGLTCIILTSLDDLATWSDSIRDSSSSEWVWMYIKGFMLNLYGLIWYLYRIYSYSPGNGLPILIVFQAQFKICSKISFHINQLSMSLNSTWSLFGCTNQSRSSWKETILRQVLKSNLLFLLLSLYLTMALWLCYFKDLHSQKSQCYLKIN